MSLSASEQQALDSIEATLTSADHKLVSLLATFARLASGEEMLVRERVRIHRRLQVTRGRQRKQRCSRPDKAGGHAQWIPEPGLAAGALGRSRGRSTVGRALRQVCAGTRALWILSFCRGAGTVSADVHPSAAGRADRGDTETSAEGSKDK